MSVGLLNLPELVTSIILKSFDFATIKILRIVCTTTNEWVERNWNFWKKTKFAGIEFPWFRDENYFSIATLLNHYSTPVHSLRFRSHSQTHFYSQKVFSRLCKFINTQFDNTMDPPSLFARVCCRFPNSNLTCDPIYPTPEQDRTRRFPGRPLYYIVKFTFDFEPGFKYHLNSVDVLKLATHEFRGRVRLDEIRELTLTIHKKQGFPGTMELERVIIKLRCQSSVDRRGENGWGAPKEIFRDWPSSSLKRDSKEEEQLYKDYYLPRIM